MKFLLVLILLVLPNVWCDESIDDLLKLLDDPKVLSEIVKRLGDDTASATASTGIESKFDPSEKDNVDTSTDANCKHKKFDQTIIATKASTSAGASFLDSILGLKTDAECIEKCCDMEGCELAVYENKGKRNCYLFACKDKKTGENLCEFANHDGYISTSVTHSIHNKGTLSVSEHENDLQDLSESGKKSEEKAVPTTTTTTTTTTTVTPATTTTTTTEKPEAPYSVKLGEKCRSIKGCEDSHAGCISGTCSCKNSYYDKKGVCREVCGHSRFECQVVGLDGPDCVRLSLVCDGTNDCHDGSDEVNCQTDDDGKKQRTKPSDSQEDKTGKHVHDNSGGKKTGDKPDSSTEDEETSEELKSHTGSKTGEKSQESTSSDESKSSDDSATKNADGNTLKGDKGKPKTNTDSKPKQSVNKVTTVEVDTLKEESYIVTKEKVIVASPTLEAQGPIIALSIGLACTFMLLVYMGCRMRNIKKRLRKGRVLHSNEADYLINGMYL